MMWRTERFNHAGVIVSNLENIVQQIWKSTWLKKSEGARALTLNGHDASGG